MKRSKSIKKKQGEKFRVCLRLRPTNKYERSRRSRNCVEVHEEQTSLTVNSPLEGEFDFSFDKVFPETASQKAVYEFSGSDVAQDLLSGINCAVIAYGQTGSGKTHTMMGAPPQDGIKGSKANSSTTTSEILSSKTNTMIEAQKDLTLFSSSNSMSNSNDNAPEERDCIFDESNSKSNSYTTHTSYEEVSFVTVEEEETDGLIQRIIRDLFQKMNEAPASMEYIVRCSYIEIYLEKVFDLLNPSSVPLKIVDGKLVKAIANDLICFPSNPSSDNASLSNTEKTAEESSGKTAEESSQNICFVPNNGTYIEGACEACCFNKEDIITLLVRGNSCRTVSSTKMDTDLSRSHVMFIVNVEQIDKETGISI